MHQDLPRFKPDLGDAQSRRSKCRGSRVQGLGSRVYIGFRV